MAIILCLYHPNARLLGISSVAGNQTLERCTRNALRTLVLAGAEGTVPVYVGASRPFMRPAKNCPEIHGADGLGLRSDASGAGWAWADTHVGTPTEGNRLEAIRDAVLSLPPGQQLTLLCTGCLTDAALFIACYPELATPERLRIVLMGGAIDRGNTGTKAEFNIELDPEAAERVFTSGLDVTMVPLEVTHTALATPDVLARIEALHGAAETGDTHEYGSFMVDLLTFFEETYKTVFGFEAGPVHDPCAALVALEPELFTTARYATHVECAGSRTYGATCVDVFGFSGEPANATVALAMQVDAFWDRMIDALVQAAAHCRYVPRVTKG